MGYIINVLKGVLLGIAFVIPGFSGGTMAVILKIYDRLLNAISLNFKKLKKNIPFLLTLVIGLAIGIYLTSFGLTWLFEHYPVATKLTLVGIVCGSLPMIWHECTSESKFKTVNLIPFIISVGIMVVMFFLENADASDVVQRDLSVGLAVKLVLGGIIAAVSMIIPGISGSLMLTIMGMYQTATTSVKEMNLVILVPFAAGAFIGLLAGAKCIAVLLKKCRQGTYAVIIGLIVGSLLTIFPSDFSFNAEGIIGIVLLIIGFIVPIIFDRADRKHSEKA